MPERLDRVTVTTSSRGAVSIPWESREALLREIGHRESTAGGARLVAARAMPARKCR